MKIQSIESTKISNRKQQNRNSINNYGSKMKQQQNQKYGKQEITRESNLRGSGIGISNISNSKIIIHK